MQAHEFMQLNSTLYHLAQGQHDRFTWGGAAAEIAAEQDGCSTHASQTAGSIQARPTMDAVAISSSSNANDT